MRTLRWALALAIPAVWVAAALTAGNFLAEETKEKILPEGTTIQLLLLRQKSVQKELKLPPNVIKTIYEFTNKQSAAFQAALKLEKDEQTKKIDQLAKENQKFLDDTLKEEQHKRLVQITFQITGLYQLTRPEIIKALDLTADQQKKFKDLQKEARKRLEGLIYAKERVGRSEKLGELRKEARKQIMAELTDEQKAKVRELVGAPFEGKIILEGEGPATTTKE